MYVYSIAISYEVRMRQALGKFIRIVVIEMFLYSSCVIHRWHHPHTNPFVAGLYSRHRSYTPDVCTDDPYNNERMDHGYINVARFLCTVVRLFKCSNRTEIERRRPPWIWVRWLVLRAHGRDGNVCFPSDRLACDIPLAFTDYQDTYWSSVLYKLPYSELRLQV